MSTSVGVAISTTGSRTEMLERAQDAWRSALGPRSLLTTVYDVQRAGVAAAKNRGLTLLMREPKLDHLFLVDDDAYPLSPESWERYVDDPALHLSLSWGIRRALGFDGDGHSLWSHPRGVLLYMHRSVVERVGGMRTEFGRGGDEHVEYSHRIHQAGLATHPYMDLNQDPRDWFHCEDWQQPGETIPQLRARRRRITTIQRTAFDRKRIAQVWKDTDGDTSFVPYESEQP